MSMETLRVELGSRSYEIRIGPGLVDAAGAAIAPFVKRGRVGVVTDEQVAGLHLAALETSLRQAGIEPHVVITPAGEIAKSFDEYARVQSALLDLKFSRDDVIVAFGGGVIGDLAGFVAATMLRGVDFIQIPTTLLSQVDSSVGGKTGINAPQGKNLVGSFHQPRLVLADTGLLDTLSAREFLSGYAEVAKYGLLGDEAFFEWLERAGPAIKAGDAGARIEAIRRSCEMKAEIVARDETEAGERALLNLGHTFGHALEAATGYSGRLRHGEAVAIGCGLAFETSMRLGLCSQETPSRVRAHFEAMGMKRTLADIEGELPEPAALIDLMRGDKKARGGSPVFILAKDIGESFVARDVDLSVVTSVLQDALAAR